MHPHRNLASTESLEKSLQRSALNYSYDVSDLTIHSRGTLLRTIFKRASGRRVPLTQALGPKENHMGWLITKYLITAAIVIAVSELAKRSDRLGGFVAALPLVTFLALIWLYVDNQPQEKIANHAWYTFWYVLPTLPMFLAFPVLLPRLGFWLTMFASVGITVVCFGMFALAVRQFGIQLLP